ncbi:ribonuclease HII [Spiroplasma clarkii]|uniref:Ribonuclease n=1 Tax=Spiroplasma clarkii TaxID=2139 RepID=A0A1Y0L201_9MOLU|nr:ribonuclease HII [Spiroplasma clarkii]ARU92003.1 ribonuclease HII [Spiroplasma clarkii]ATX71336.1 ribonuclease HII [Spiroplasma clarkii]
MVDTSRYDFDQNLKKQYQVKVISGSDEVGRGAMAGPIVVATVILKPDYCNPQIKDSKLLTAAKREQLYTEIIANTVAYSIKEYSALIVDKLNPKATSVLGMCESIQDLQEKPQLCLTDGEKVNLQGYQTLQVIKGDFKSQSIAAASILAKVYRDKIMINYDVKYKGYKFSQHKGYCTKEHIKLVESLGILDVHRLSYKPIAKLQEK